MNVRSDVGRPRLSVGRTGQDPLAGLRGFGISSKRHDAAIWQEAEDGERVKSVHHRTHRLAPDRPQSARRGIVDPMSNVSFGLPPDLHAYLVSHGVREPDVLRRLREETALLPQHDMQIAPEQGAFMAMLVGLIDARRCIELGTFTGYSSLAVALALPPDGSIVCCDVSEEWTSVARRYWAEAGIEDRVELRIGPALATLDDLIADDAAGTFDFAFIDASKREYPEYHERIVRLLRQGGLAVYDNVLWDGGVIDGSMTDEDTVGVRRLNDRVLVDERLEICMIPVADGLTLVRKR